MPKSKVSSLSVKWKVVSTALALSLFLLAVYVYVRDVNNVRFVRLHPPSLNWRPLRTDYFEALLSPSITALLVSAGCFAFLALWFSRVDKSQAHKEDHQGAH